MKCMAAVVAALGISTAAIANDASDLTQMEEQSYDRIASMDADEYYLVEEYILVPSDTVVLIPLEDEESASDAPG